MHSCSSSLHAAILALLAASCWSSQSWSCRDTASGACSVDDLQDSQDESASEMQLLQVDLHVRTGRRKRAAKQERYRQLLHNRGNTEYTGDFKLGGQSLRGIFDTGSFELVAFAKNCTTCGLSGTFGYDGVLSLTYTPGLLAEVVSYGSGDALATDAVDTFALGPFHVARQAFWEAQEAHMPVLQYASFQAIVGLGPPGHPQEEALQQLARDDSMVSRAVVGMTFAKNDSLLENLDVRYISECLSRDSEEAEGYLIWNDDPHAAGTDGSAANRSLFSEIEVVGTWMWAVHMSNARLAGSGTAVELGCESGCGVILDTGTSLITAPTSVYNTAFEALSKLDSPCSDLSGLPYLEFELGGVLHRLPPDVYIGVTTTEVPPALQEILRLPPIMQTCQFLLMDAGAIATPHGPLWILGMPFFRHYYTTFDLGENTTDPAGRKIWTAPSSEDCHPVAASQQPLLAQVNKSAEQAGRAHVLSLDVSKARAPEWLLRLVNSSSKKVFRV